MNATANLAELKSECGNLTLMASHPRRDMLIVGVAQQGLWVSEDGAATWSRLGLAPGSAVITNRPSSIQFDPIDQNSFWESGIYNGGGVYRTLDNGKTFAQLGDVTHVDVVSVDLADPAHQTLVATTHEKSQPLRSGDGGASWTDVSAGLPSGVGFTSNSMVINATTQLLGSQNPSGGAGVFRTTTAGTQWTRVYDKGVWGQPLRSTSDTAIYWLLQFGGGLIKSSDDGVSWQQVVGPDIFSSSPGSSSNLIELPDGRLGALGRERILLSQDHGTTWSPVGRPLPFNAWGLIYSSSRSSFFIWHWDCGPVVLSDAIMRLPFDYRKN